MGFFDKLFGEKKQDEKKEELREIDKIEKRIKELENELKNKESR